MSEEVDEIIQVLEDAEELVTAGQFRVTLTRPQINLLLELLREELLR